MAKSKRKRVPKTVLKLPDLEQSKSAVLNNLTSSSSKRSYAHAIREFIDWYCSEPRLAFNRTVVTRYRIALEQHAYAPSTINLRLAAIRRLAYEASDCGLLSPDLAAGIRRVKGVRRLGVRVGNWLTAEEGKKLLGAETADTLRSRRNRALLSLLIGCGLRRAEVTNLRLEDLQLREGHWVNADLRFQAQISPNRVVTFAAPNRSCRAPAQRVSGGTRHTLGHCGAAGLELAVVSPTAYMESTKRLRSATTNTRRIKYLTMSSERSAASARPCTLGIIGVTPV
jgi:hypothetical protein